MNPIPLALAFDHRQQMRDGQSALQGGDARARESCRLVYASGSPAWLVWQTLKLAVSPPPAAAVAGARLLLPRRGRPATRSQGVTNRPLIIFQLPATHESRGRQRRVMLSTWPSRPALICLLFPNGPALFPFWAFVTLGSEASLYRRPLRRLLACPTAC